MSTESITLSYKQIGAIVLVLVNILLVGPGGWILKHLWDETQTFRNETKDQIDDLQKQLSELQVELSTNYLPRKSFSNYKEEMGEALRHLDSKITP
ncbi:hypothetical protein [Bacterioplanoides sp.]|uniref:hypothetical protein n=1 Tax=Bacterioplanoides sp. TaxID=2066072 RepID=UPI003B5C2D4F